MAFDIGNLLQLWTEPLTDDGAALARFRSVYADPVRVNGTEFSAGDMVARARGLQAALADVEREVLDVVENGEKVAVAFRLHGTQVGPLATGGGVLPATNKRLTLRVIDILTLSAGVISSIWMVADELGALAAVDAVRLGSSET